MFKRKLTHSGILVIIAFFACLLIVASAYGDDYNSVSVDLNTASRTVKSMMYVPPESRVPTEEKININTASAPELATLPGIGEVRAQAIIDYREKTGGFTTVAQLLLVDGIGQVTYDKIKDLCTV